MVGFFYYTNYGVDPGVQGQHDQSEVDVKFHMKRK